MSVLTCCHAGGALADGPVGPDPSSNYPPGPMPASCQTSPTGAPCIDAAVGYLNQARATLGQGPYELPSDFDSMPPDRQALILTNLDRLQYGLVPIPGLTEALDQDATAGVQSDADPTSSDQHFSYYTSNWAGGYVNLPLAYEAWMYDDGPGSGNLDCTSANTSGCWGHRHDVLWQFGGSGALAMGATAGTDGWGNPGDAMLLGEGDSSYQPQYTYTWTQAVADGAGTSPPQPPSPASPPPASTPPIPPALPPAAAASLVGVSIIVHGPGRVVDQTGASCGVGSCRFQEIEGVPAQFVPRPRTGVVFLGWQGACNGFGGCRLTPDGSTLVLIANFAYASNHARVRITTIRIRAHRVAIHIAVPKDARLRCALTRHSTKGWPSDRFSRCSRSMTYSRLTAGRYRITVRTSTSLATRYFVVN